MIYLFLFGLLLCCIATASTWAGRQSHRPAEAEFGEIGRELLNDYPGDDSF